MVIGLAWALGVWAGTYYEAQRSDYEESEAQPYHGTLDRSTFWQERPGTSESYKAICGGPIDESQADLCQQWRSANAAEQMAGYALVSLLFGFAGLIGVGITVHLSNKATNAATEATKAAIEANEISRRIGEAQTRAYMSAAEGRAEIVRDDDSGAYALKLTVNFANSGSSPAIRFRWGALIAFAYLGSECDTRGRGLVTPEAEGYDVPANTPKFAMWLTYPEFRLSAADIKAWRLGRLRVYVDIYTVFRDVFGDEISHVEYFRCDFPARISKKRYVNFNYGKGIKSIPSYLDELRSNGVRRNDGRRLGGRIERAKEDDEDDEIW